MRRIAVTAALATLVLVFIGRAPCTAAPAPSASETPSPPPTMLYLSAKRVDFYYDRFLIEADGNVQVKTSDGFTVTGDTFSMDLKLNRFLVAGNVTLHDASGTVSGAAISDFLDFERIYFVPVTTAPDRWTFLNGDLAHPAKGREMPGDAFYFPVIAQHPSITAGGAIVETKNYVRFMGANVDFAGTEVPLGSDVVNFSANQYFAQNTLSGASVDLSWNVFGSPNALTALHLRYDPTYYLYGSVEQHLVGSHDYAIFSVNPATKAEKWWNTMLYEKLGSRFQIQTFTQVYTQQVWLGEPSAAQQTTYMNATYGFPHSSLQATAQLTNYNLLGPDSLFVTKTVAGSLNHPSQLQLSYTSTQNKIGKLPLYEQIFGGYGFNNDSVGSLYKEGPGIPPITVPGLQAYGAPCPDQYDAKHPPIYYCPVYTRIWNTVAGFTLFTPSLKLNPSASPYETYSFNASLTKERQWNSLPHYIDTTLFNATISRQFSRAIYLYGGYQIQNVGDRYINGGYQECIDPGTPSCPDSFTAFRGLSTFRTASLGFNALPKPDFNFSLLLRRHDDFPIPVPGLFSFPPNNIIGQPLYSYFLGQPPYDVTGDVRFKVFPHGLLDVSRTYYWYGKYFNGNPNPTSFWQPNFVVQLLPI